MASDMRPAFIEASDAIGKALDEIERAWGLLHEHDAEGNSFECGLCGAVMFPAMSYEHAEHCPKRVAERAVTNLSIKLGEIVTEAGDG